MRLTGNLAPMSVPASGSAAQLAYRAAHEGSDVDYYRYDTAACSAQAWRAQHYRHNC
jgi:hypothetical protein